MRKLARTHSEGRMGRVSVGRHVLASGAHEARSKMPDLLTRQNKDIWMNRTFEFVCRLCRVFRTASWGVLWKSMLATLASNRSRHKRCNQALSPVPSSLRARCTLSFVCSSRYLNSAISALLFAMWWRGHGSTDGEAGGGAAIGAHMWCWERQLVSVYFVVMTILVSPALLHLDLVKMLEFALPERRLFRIVLTIKHSCVPHNQIPACGFS